MDTENDMAAIRIHKLAAMTDQLLIQMRLDSVDRRLSQYHPGTEPRDLVAIRSDLIAKAIQTLHPLPSGISDQVSDYSHLTLPEWLVIDVPVLEESLQYRPDWPDTSGALQTFSLGPGRVLVDADLVNNGPVDQAWMHSWYSRVLFPPAPAIGMLAYRFRVNATLKPSLATAVLGGMRAMLVVGVTSDIQTEIDFPPDPASWHRIVDVALPLTAVGSAFLSGTEYITGQIPVLEQRQAALGLLFSVTVILEHGRVVLGPGNAGFTTHYSDSPGPQTLGAIEYRFLPEFWLRANADIIAFSRGLLPH